MHRSESTHNHLAGSLRHLCTTSGGPSFIRKGLSIQSLAKREVSVDAKNHGVRTYLHLRLLRTRLSILRPPRSHIQRLIITRKNLASSKPPPLTFSLPSFYKTQKANANHQSCKALPVSFLCSPSLQLRRSRTGVESMKKARHNGTSTSPHPRITSQPRS